MTQTEPDPRFPSLAIKTVVCHTVTYFVMGALAYYFLDYAEAFARPELICWMRPTDDPLVRVGVLFQPIRGLLFASVIFPLRSILFRTRGWMVMSWMLVAVGVLAGDTIRSAAGRSAASSDEVLGGGRGDPCPATADYFQPFAGGWCSFT